jgi:hypothetical protein
MDTYTKTVEQHYTSINGEEFRTSEVIDFLEDVKKASLDVPLAWRSEYEPIANVLCDEGLIGETSRAMRAAWYPKEEDEINKLLARLSSSLEENDGN